jgi:hypothetical protein
MVFEDSSDFSIIPLPTTLAEFHRLPTWPREEIVPDAVARQFITQKPQESVLRCRQVKALLEGLKIEYGEEPVTRAGKMVPGTRNFSAAILASTMPILSADGSYALVWQSSYYGPLAGGQEVYIFHKNRDGRWKRVQMIAWTVS